MSASWVAGTVRARALARRRLGRGGARSIAGRASLAEAVRGLADSPYGHDVRPGQDLAAAERATGAALLWNLRVLAGWLPRDGSATVRLLGSWFEVADVDERLALLEGGAGEEPYTLGALATAWGRVAGCVSTDEVAAVLARSPWRVRDVRSPRDVAVGLRLGWAEAVLASVPEARTWARAAAALLVLAELSAEGRRLAPGNAARAARLLGTRLLDVVPAGADDLRRARSALPRDAAWVLEDVTAPGELWVAERAWWRRVERDGFALLAVPGFGRAPVVGAVAVLGADARRVRAALEAADRGGPDAVEAFDAVA